MSIASENKAVLFIRHADIDPNNDQALSDIGIQQSIMTAEYLLQNVN